MVYLVFILIIGGASVRKEPSIIRKLKINRRVVLFIIRVFGLILGLILILLQLFLSFSLIKKRSSFECGFSRIGRINTNYSLYFFILLLVFILFDLEVILLLSFLYGRSLRLIVFFFIILFIFRTYYLEVHINKIVWGV